MFSRLFSAILRTLAPATLIAALLSGPPVSPARAQSDSQIDDLVAEVRTLTRAGRHAEAMDVAQKGIGAFEAKWGREDVRTAAALYGIGHALRWQSRYASAKELLLRALPIFERSAQGKDNADIARTLTELGWTSVYTLALKDAEGYFTRALKINQALFGPDSIPCAWSLDGLATASIYGSQFDAAERYAEQSLEIKKQRLDPAHDDIGVGLASLATAKFKNGKLTEAADLFDKVLQMERAKSEPDRVRLADITGLLALVRFDKGDYATAERLIREVLESLEQSGAIERGTYYASFNLLAKILVFTNRFADGEAAAKEVVEAYGVVQVVTARDVLDANNTLSIMYVGLDRYAEAEQALKKSLTVAEETFGENSLDVSVALENLAFIYSSIERSQEALELFGRILRIRKTVLPEGHAQIGSVYTYRARVYNRLRRYQEAEADAREAIRIVSAVYGDTYPMVMTTRDELGTALKGLGRYDEAVQVYKESIDRALAADGEKSLRVPVYLHNVGLVYDLANRYAEAEEAFLRSIAAKQPGTIFEAQTRKVLADLYFKTSRHAEARENYRRAMAVFVEAFVKTAASRTEYEGGIWLKATASAYVGVLKAVSDASPSEREATAKEAFEAAQWLLRTSTSTTLSQLGARYAAGSGDLAQRIRARQDDIQRWQTLNAQLDRTISQPIADRSPTQVVAIRSELAQLETRLADADKVIAEKFPAYAELAGPRPVTVDEVRKLIHADEALLQFAFFDQRAVAWTVTKSNVSWYSIPLGNDGLATLVAALRCGLDYDGAWADGGARCTGLLGMKYSGDDRRLGLPLPFDLARAHSLYKLLFEQAEKLVAGKHVLVVASGALTQLPLQVLVERLPAGSDAGLQQREVALVGLEMRDLTEEARRQAQLVAGGGVSIVKAVPGGPADLAGLKADDILLSVGGRRVSYTAQAVEAVRAQTPRSAVRLTVWRGAEVPIDVQLSATTLQTWRPLFLQAGAAREVAWFGRSHAITVLPAVSSLKALRLNAKASRARKPFLGVGNPLLDGPNSGFAALSEAARQRRRCGPASAVQVAAARTGVGSVVQRSGIADVAELRQAPPLPETADELCSVAAMLGVGDADVLLGARASEVEIARLNAAGRLRDYRIVHFATHGVLAGEASGSAEPGLVLTPPAVGSAANDGYLSASEIAGLNLDADWVILSACNTAAGDAKGAESFSGLARAFFYAGARALLVSHWYVDSNATVALIKGAFMQLRANPRLGRAEALRRSMRALMDGTADTSSHPSAWAPFVVVGEGSASR